MDKDEQEKKDIMKVFDIIHSFTKSEIDDRKEQLEEELEEENLTSHKKKIEGKIMGYNECLKQIEDTKKAAKFGYSVRLMRDEKSFFESGIDWNEVVDQIWAIFIYTGGLMSVEYVRVELLPLIGIYTPASITMPILGTFPTTVVTAVFYYLFIISTILITGETIAHALDRYIKDFVRVVRYKF